MEMWRDIVGFEGLYQISSLGNVKSMDRITVGGKHVKERILKLQINTHGYHTVVLRKNKKSFTKEVHRLVAIAFIPNPDNLPQVSHKDESRTNNSVDNLEWATRKDNCNMPLRKERLSKKCFRSYGKDNYFYGKHFCGGENPSAMSVECDGRIFDCIKDCASFYGLPASTLAWWLRNNKLPKIWIDRGMRYHCEE